MLVRRGVEHHLGPEPVERAVDALGVLHVADHREHPQLRVLGHDLVMHEVQPVLGVVEQHQLRGHEARDLSHQLGTDRTSGARHDDPLAAQEVAHLVHVEFDRLAAEQVLDTHVAHLGQRGAPLLQVGQAGQRLHAHLRLRAEAGDLAHDLRGHRRVGDHDDLDLPLLQHARQVGDRAQHRDALDQVPGESRLVVDDKNFCLIHFSGYLYKSFHREW